MKSIAELPEVQQTFLYGLAMDHASRSLSNVDPLDVARILFDCLRCSDEDLRDTEIARNYRKASDAEFDMTWQAFSKTKRKVLRPHMAALVSVYATPMSWTNLSRPKECPAERLAASLGVLLNICLKWIANKAYEREIRDHLALVDLNVRDLTILLVGLLRGVAPNVKFLTKPYWLDAGEYLDADDTLRNVLMEMSAGNDRRDLARRRRKSDA